MQPFTAGDVDDVGVGRRHLERSDRAGCFTIEDRCPRPAKIGCLPYPTIHRADVEDIRLAGHTRDSAGTASAKWPDVSPMHLAQKPGVDLLTLEHRSETEGCKQKEGRNCRRISRHE